LKFSLPRSLFVGLDGGIEAALCSEGKAKVLLGGVSGNPIESDPCIPAGVGHYEKRRVAPARS
jgi:uncharacterized protein YjlB